MNDFFEKILDSEFVRTVREWWNIFLTKLEEKTANISFLNSAPSKKMLGTAFVILMSVLLLISAVSIAKEGKSEEETTLTDVTETTQAKASENIKQLDATFLLALTNNEKSKVHSIAVVKFNSAEEKLVFRFVDPTQTVNVNDYKGDMNAHLVKGGINQFLWAVSEYTETGFNRYIIADEEDFYNITQMVGDIDVIVKERISYDHDGINFIIDEDNKELTVDMMLKYYLYISSEPKKYAEEMIYVLTDYLSKLLTATDDYVLEEKFCSAIGLFTTDISAIDFTNYRDLIRSIPEMKLYEMVEIEK